MSEAPELKHPCNDCPFRKNAPAGWLGPYTPQEWKHLAHSDEIIACHLTVHENDEGETEWDGTQCKGAADYRANVCKLPPPGAIKGARNPDVFATPMAFLEHHGSWSKE